MSVYANNVELSSDIAIDNLAATNVGGAKTNVENTRTVELRVEDRIRSSEQDEPSVLFSEQLGTKTEPTEAMDDGQAITADNGQAEFSPADFVEEDERSEYHSEFCSYSDTVNGEEYSPSSSGGSSPNNDDDGTAHLRRWREQYCHDRRLSSSDGEEDLDEFTKPQWEDHEASMDEGSLAHYQRYNRKVARYRKQIRCSRKHLNNNRESTRSKPRTTRETFEEQLMEGVEMKSYHSGDSDDFLMNHRPPLERAGVKRDIKLFQQSMNVLSGVTGEKVEYKVVDRLGEGKLGLLHTISISADNKVHSLRCIWPTIYDIANITIRGGPIKLILQSDQTFYTIDTRSNLR